MLLQVEIQILSLDNYAALCRCRGTQKVAGRQVIGPREAGFRRHRSPEERLVVPLSLVQEVPPFEIIGDRQVEGTFALRGGIRFVSGADLGVCQRGPGICHRPFETPTVRLLRLAPLHVGHIRLFDEGLPAVHVTEGEIGDRAVQFVDDGVKVDFRHCCSFIGRGMSGSAQEFLYSSCTDRWGWPRNDHGMVAGRDSFCGESPWGA